MSFNLRNDAMKIQKELFFTLDEYEQRLKSLREKMAARELDVLLLATPFGFHRLKKWLVKTFYLVFIVVHVQRPMPRKWVLSTGCEL